MSRDIADLNATAGIFVRTRTTFYAAHPCKSGDPYGVEFWIPAFAGKNGAVSCRWWIK
jgi:hypothetical protein